MPPFELHAATLKPDGRTVGIPVFHATADADHHIVVEGLFRVGQTGEEFDAAYKAGTYGQYWELHDYLRWYPHTPYLKIEDKARHRYSFMMPPEWFGQGAGVSVDLLSLARDLLLPPSEIQAQMTGSLYVRVLRTPPETQIPWQVLGVAALPAAAVVGGVGWVIRRRMALRGLSADLQAELESIERKVRTARAAVRGPQSRLFPLGERLSALRQGAYGVARQIQDLRNAQRLTDRGTLEGEIAALERRAAELPDPAVRAEAAMVLAKKRESLEMLSELRRAEAACSMRLNRIDALLETTRLSLRSASVHASPSGGEDALCRDLDAEVAAIREAARDYTVEAAAPQVLLRGGNG
ncbi:MAG TPA: hypothetical protein VK689_09380 [Armatimonadota bacterium]|nr:hypothetical protein [Armatimonadota bacterium]